MDIKLKARLSAYSKVNEISSGDQHIERVPESEIDSLFTDTDEPKSVTKTEIDELFDEAPADIISVTHSEIDSLFN